MEHNYLRSRIRDRNQMKRLILLMATVFLPLFTSAQGTFTAISCNRIDVNNIINGPIHVAVDGDTIQIPAGSCTWSSSIAVPNSVGISIVGSGTPNIGSSTPGAGTVNTSITNGGFTLNPVFGNAISRISTINFLPGTGSPINVNGTCAAGGCPNLRLDNLTFPSSWAAVGLSDGSVANVTNMWGVADHNTIGDVAPSTAYLNFLTLGNGNWGGIGNWGDNSWAQPDTMGTNQTFFLENNIFNFSLGTDTDNSGTNGGGARLACRFNTFNNVSFVGVCSGHGTDTTGRPRGTRQWEGYYNTGSCPSNNTQGCGSAWPGRAGLGVSFANTFTNIGGANWKALNGMGPQRRWRADAPYLGCNGLSPFDTNDGVTYFTGTIGSVSGIGTGNWTINDSGSPGWSINQWATNGSGYEIYDVTQNYGLYISSN